MGYGMVNPPNLENLPFRREKAMVQSVLQGNRLAGPRTFGQQLLLKRDHKEKFSEGSL